VHYELLVEPEVHAARKHLPGYIRQQIKRAFDDLTGDPRPHNRRTLDITELSIPPGIELRRLRLEHWRIVYAVNDEEGWVWALAVHRRPPYDYADLPDLANRLR